MIPYFDALFLIVLAIILVYLYLTWNFSYWKKRGIDCDDKISIFFGSLTDGVLGRTPLGVIYTNIYRKFPGKKVVGYFKFQSPALVIRDPEIIRKILISDFNYFLNNDVNLDPEVDPIMGRNLFLSKDELWKKGRALMTPVLTAGKIKAMYPTMQEVAKEFVEHLKEHPEEIHVKTFMSKYSSEIVARCAFGIEGDNFKDPNAKMHEMGELIWGPDIIRNLKMTALFVMPTVTKILRLKLVPKEVVEFFNYMLRDMVLYRKDNNIGRNDVVQYLLEIKRKTLEAEKGNIQTDMLKRVYTDNDVLSGLIQFFAESYETTSLTLNNVLYQLALHRDVQDTLRAEVDEVLAEGELTFDKLHAMKYLNSVFSETIRLMPVVFSMQKVCTNRYEMDIGEKQPLVIEKGTCVSLPLYAIHMDPAYWDDPEDFKPERFATKEDEALAKSRGIYLPFSDGPRICPGMRIASTMVKLAVVRILSQLEVLPTSKTPQKIEFDPTYFLVGHKGGIHLRFAPRSS